MEPALIALIVIALLMIIVFSKAVTIVPQAQAKVTDRCTRYAARPRPASGMGH